MVGMQQIKVCYKKLNKIYTVWDINMKLIQRLFHMMINRPRKHQGCTSIYTGQARGLDVPVVLLTLRPYASFATLLLTFWPLVMKYHSYPQSSYLWHCLLKNIRNQLGVILLYPLFWGVEGFFWPECHFIWLMVRSSKIR